ncbi:FAD-dependent oxidoreductase [Lentzea tibetensis]|uniref:FAD-dependent oxidoreductase n=1 Tax=Lentzea tibetensis TaxID=2591470 RepID=A0A563EM13_9PSEU|nr:FAD-dependent oxidoreductase [Lentzea tibetensis]TWP48176.1 FAD-dependent oxidoreductase [Lentzea tibetensis]
MPRVVVVGAGIVGCALADELTERGWTDVTVLDQADLFAKGGSSSHAPGLVFQTNACRSMTSFAQYTVEKYTELGCFESVGGIEIATSEARLRDLSRRHGWATSWGVPSRLIDPDEVVGLYPLLDEKKILGGFLIPSDGLAKPVLAAETQARRAIERGARFLGNQKVVGVETQGDRVTGVRTETDTFEADVVVSCAGMWGPVLGEMVGLTVPLVPMAHQYAFSGTVGETPKPILRHQEADLYFRAHGDQLGIGAYGHRPMPINAHDITGSELPFTKEDFEESWTQAIDVIPSLGEAGIDHGFNGLFSFTSDGMPLLGEHPSLQGFWVAEAVWITHSAGVAKAMAEWMIDGQPELDVHSSDLNRFERHQLAPDYVLERSCQNFVEVYDVLHPLQSMDSPRPLRTSPFYRRQQELGALFLEASGWERPHWFEANADLPEVAEVPDRNDWAARFWSPICGAEALVTRKRVAMYDMTALKRLEVTGPNALRFLDELTTNNLRRKPGAVVYTLLLGEDGGVRSDLTVARLGPDRFQVGANGNLDLDWFTRHQEDGVYIRDITPGTCCIGLWGPKARDLIEPISTVDTRRGYFTAQEAFVGNVPVTALRLSYVGELGWELYTTSDMGEKLWDTLWEAGQQHGVIAAGRGAFNSLRLEKGYRSWGVDMTTEHTPYQAGLGFAVKIDPARDFVGRNGLEEREASHKLTCLVIDDPYQVVLGSEPVFVDGYAAGYVTSAAYGYTTGLNIAYAWLPYGTEGEVEIEYFGSRVAARVAGEPLFDPQMTRLRS